MDRDNVIIIQGDDVMDSRADIQRRIRNFQGLRTAVDHGDFGLITGTAINPAIAIYHGERRVVC